MEELINVVDWSRAQFALTAIYHWLFVPLTLHGNLPLAVRAVDTGSGHHRRRDGDDLPEDQE